MKNHKDNSHQDIVEGDIKMTAAQAAIFKKGGWSALVKSDAWEVNAGVWPRYIPYEISNIPVAERTALTASIKMIEQFTCLKFVTRSSQRDYLQFIDNNGCWSWIGKSGGRQEVSLSSGCRVAVPVHEIMHALGRHHEQSRPDRDNYVRILTANIRDGQQHNFNKEDDSDTQKIPYDYLSLMHYGAYGFSKNNLKTIQTLDPTALIGQRTRLTLYDAMHINLKYCPEKVVRLVGGSSGPHDGRVEVYWNGQWGTVCDDSFDINDANVICKYLGYPEAVSAFSNAHFGQGYGPIWFDNMNCAGNERSPYHCPQNVIGSHNCRHHEDAGVVCRENVRLVGGNPYCGRVEVYVDGRWGTVCDDGFGQADANVICRQLGYSRASAYYHNARYGQGTVPILLDDLSCTGDEVAVSHCQAQPVGEHNCQHSEDASVVCTT